MWGAVNLAQMSGVLAGGNKESRQAPTCLGVFRCVEPIRLGVGINTANALEVNRAAIFCGAEMQLVDCCEGATAT